MKRAVMVIFGLLLLSSLCSAAEDPSIRPREWILNCQAANQTNFIATYLGRQGQNVVLRMPDGLEREIIAAHLNWKDLGYVQRQLCKFPVSFSRPTVSGEKKLLVDISVDDLPAGPLTEWKNRGELGGAFHALNTPLNVEEIDGKKAVRFYYGPWNLPLDYMAMMADFYTPETLSKNGPFTAAVWVYNPSKLGEDMNRESILSWHTINGDDGTDIGYGAEGRYPHEKSTVGGAYCGAYGGFGFPDAVWPAVNQWHHIVYVFSGVRDGNLRIYINGKLASDRQFNRSILLMPATEIAKDKVTLNADLYLRDGKPVLVTALLGEEDNHYLRGVENWKTLKDLPSQGPGKVSVNIGDLKPGTRYYYRFVVTADNETRWSDGAGQFVTAAEDGTPGKNLPRDETMHMFLGCNFGSMWDWSSRPRWFFTGGLAELKLYSGMLSDAEIKTLYGAASSSDEGTGASNAALAKATQPSPSDKSASVSKTTGRLSWEPDLEAAGQKLYIGTDRETVARGTTPYVFDAGSPQARSLRGVGRVTGSSWQVDSAGSSFKLRPGQTYYWRVDSIGSDGTSAAKGDIWSFTVENYFEPEYDSLVSEPYPTTVRQSGGYGKLMEGWGQPVSSAAECPDEYMRLCSYTMAKAFWKRPDVVECLMALNCGAKLDYVDGGAGNTGFTNQTYGNVRTFKTDPTFYWGINIMVHENGHQFQEYGAQQEEADFQARLYEVFWENKKEGKWMGDYGGFNMWEYMACAISSYVSDGADDDLICRRETFRKSDPRMFYFLQDYYPGDTLVELNPVSGMQVDAAGKVTSWENIGGLEYWGKFGLNKYTWSTGAFEPVGNPKLATVKGVSAVRFAGKDALGWNKRTRECLIGNHAWSAEFWAYRDKNAASDEVLLSWGPAQDGARFVWGSSNTACDLGQGRSIAWKSKPGAGEWHHIVYTFKGGGLENGRGRFCIYVNGKLDQTGSVKLDIPTGQQIVVGGVLSGQAVQAGFTGALAHTRVYDYDLGDLQIKKHYADESGFYKREITPVAGSLLVDLDANQLDPCPVYQTRTTYPASTGRDWVRSWYNRGTAGGKMSNDKHMPEGSDPVRMVVDGITAVTFRGNDRMVSSFVTPQQMVKSPVTLEAWVYRFPTDKGRGTVLQWGNAVISSGSIQTGKWQHVAMVVNGGKAELYVNGKLAASPAGVSVPAEYERLHLGAKWDGGAWSGYFDGAVAQVRIHSGALAARDIATGVVASELRLASHPSPAVDVKVAAERKTALRWNTGVGVTNPTFNVYLSTNPADVSAGKALVGKFKTGEYAPSLKPGSTYYWRVDALDAAGKPVGKGRMWSFATYGGLLVDLSADKLPQGKLAEWKNEGRAGGKFTKGSLSGIAAPYAETWEGRKCVNFVNGKCLVSSFKAPAGITGNGDFSVSLWAFNVVLQNQSTMLAWGEIPGAGAEFNYGRQINSGAFRSTDNIATGFGGNFDTTDRWRSNAPLIEYWNHIVYTYSGGPDGVLRIYTNGILNVEKKMSLDIQRDGKFSLAAVLEQGGRRTSEFGGRLADVMVYDYALSKDEALSLYNGTGPKPDASKLLIKLSAEGMSEGIITSWKNQGTLGGEFVLPTVSVDEPVVQTVAGRKAVTFDGAKAFLQSDIRTPAGVTRVKPVTIEAWVNNPEVGDAETVFSLAPRRAYLRTPFEQQAARALELRYNRGNDYASGAVFTGHGSRSIGWSTANGAPKAGEWHHIAFVYDGNPFGWGKVYVDGKLENSRGYYTLNTVDDQQMFLGTAWNTNRGAFDMFSGSIASLRVYDYARTDAEIGASAKAGK